MVLLMRALCLALLKTSYSEMVVELVTAVGLVVSHWTALPVPLLPSLALGQLLRS